MVRVPAKTCPNLLRVLQDAETELVSAFLGQPSFSRLEWLKHYRFDPEDADGHAAARSMLEAETKVKLGPLEIEATRIVTMSAGRGQFALEGVARSKLGSDRALELFERRDELARSLFAYVHEKAIFDAAESSLHLRLYRRYDTHYQTFQAEPSQEGGPEPGSELLEQVLEDVATRLDRGQGYSIDRFDIPGDEDDDEPPSEMYLLFHPNPPTSVREIDEAGNRSQIYYRPPGEAMVVYTPSTGRVNVRAGNRQLRHDVARSFIETALHQEMSYQPVDFQAYDISSFFSGFDLALPDFDDVIILRAQVIRAEVSVGNLANRLSLATSINQDLTSIIDSQPGLRGVFERAVAIRFVEIAARYRRTGADREETLDFTLTDRNTCSLHSLEDPFETALGHRLLRHWGILREGRPPTREESLAAIPALLALWDMGTDEVSGAWLHSRGIAPEALDEIGFLVPKGWEDEDVLDDENAAVGQVAAKVVPRPGAPELKPAEGHESPSLSSDAYRVYRVRQGWVAEHLRDRIADVLDTVAIEKIGGDMLALGCLTIDDRQVPVYLVRRLNDEKARAAIDTELRSRSGQGIGLVLQAGDLSGACIAANVLAPVLDHLDRDASDIALNAESLRSTFRRNRGLARGGETVDLAWAGDRSGLFSVPGKGTIIIDGRNRTLVIERLVDAHNAGLTPVRTGDLTKGIEDQSLANIFKQPLWGKLQAEFLRSPKKGSWEIAI